MAQLNKDQAKNIINGNAIVKGKFFQLGEDPKVNFDLIKSIMEVALLELASTGSSLSITRDKIKTLVDSTKAISLLADDSWQFNTNGKTITFKKEGTTQSFSSSNINPSHLGGLCNALQLRNLPTSINGTSREKISMAAKAFQTLIEASQKTEIASP